MIDPCESEIFQQQLVPKYFGEYWFAFGIVCAVNTHENGIFWQLLAPEYFGEYCFAFGVTCALNTAAVGAEILRRILLCLQSNMCTKYTWKWNISATLGAEILQGMLFVAWRTCALNPCESEIFQQQLVYFWDDCYPSQWIPTLNTSENDIFQQLDVLISHTRQLWIWLHRNKLNIIQNLLGTPEWDCWMWEAMQCFC